MTIKVVCIFYEESERMSSKYMFPFPLADESMQIKVTSTNATTS